MPNVDMTGMFTSGEREAGREIMRETYTEDRIAGRVVIDLSKREYAPIRVNILKRMVESLNDEDSCIRGEYVYGQSLEAIEEQYNVARRKLFRKRVQWINERTPSHIKPRLCGRFSSKHRNRWR
jgi:hypothetical protein